VTDAFDRGKAFRLFEQALGLDEPARAQFILDRCGDDAPLHAELEELLEAATADSAQTGVLLNPTSRPIENLIGERFGRFRLVEFIGEGGMGVVYRAERTDGIKQAVAIKLIGNELAGSGQERFKRETQLLARLEHPAIARLIDAGVEAGRAWIALEFVAGRPIDAYCDEQSLSLRSRVRLLADLAGAVAAAHRMLVVHRDIKPANVLVNADGVPKLIDFGIAAALQDEAAAHAQTADVGRLFTPHYAAPEQVSGEPITVATDVFGLGALGYRLLTGQTLYPEARGPIGYLLAITQRDVDRPSRVALSRSDPRSARQLRGDLDAILRKALERDPANRYSSAADLQSDLRRYLDNLPVVARSTSVVVKIGKFTRRNSLAVSIATVFAVCFIVGAVAYSLQARQAAEAREMTARRGEFLQALIKSADPRGGNRDVTVAQLLDGSAHQIENLSREEPLVAASMLGLVAETNLDLGRLPQGLAASTREIELLRAHADGTADLSAALSLRGRLLIKSGRYREAEAPLREAISLVEHLRGAEKQLGEALDDLGAAYQDSEREPEAELMYKRALDVYRKDSRAFGVEASDPVANLGVLRYNEGRYAEAAAYMREAVEIRRKYLPRDDPDMLDAEYNYASSLEKNHQAGAAEPIFRELLASYLRTLGPDHADTLMARQGIAHNLLTQKRYHEAAVEALPAAEGMSRAVGDDHDWTQTAWGVYGVAACLGGHREAGVTALRRVVMLRRNGTNANNWRTSISEVQLGICLVALGDDAEAEPLLLNAVKALEGFRGTSYDHTQAGYRALRDLYANTGRAAEAALWQKQILPGDR
jgi:tetratricopeptide (TPR) repeat protein